MRGLFPERAIFGRVSATHGVAMLCSFSMELIFFSSAAVTVMHCDLVLESVAIFSISMEPLGVCTTSRPRVLRERGWRLGGLKAD
jgi:hypothetical protein